jgi:hypothetical protein
MISIRPLALVALLALVAFALAATGGRQRFRTLVKREVTGLFSSTATTVGPNELAARWDSLPGPVQRYLHYAVPQGAPAIRTAHLKHDGFFRTKPGQRWLPIQGQEYFSVGKPGFVWNATVQAAPGIWIEARDRLLSGRGNMLVKFWSIFPIADATGAEIDQGSSLRWLAEAAWFPYAFAGDSVRWEPIDERSARATLIWNGLPVSAVFEIDGQGRLVHVRAERYRDLGGGKSALTSWGGRYSDYRILQGLRVPTSVEVIWHFKEGEFSYARFRVTEIEYNPSL